MGSLYQPGGLVFATEAGTIINPSNVRNRSLKPLLKKAGLRTVRFHDLRHTCATLLLSKNVNPKVVSEMLGHSSISVTLDIYSHLLPDMQEKAAMALEEVLQWPSQSALQYGCSKEPPDRKPGAYCFLRFAGFLKVGDAGFEPATSAV